MIKREITKKSAHDGEIAGQVEENKNLVKCNYSNISHTDVKFLSISAIKTDILSCSFFNCKSKAIIIGPNSKLNIGLVSNSHLLPAMALIKTHVDKYIFYRSTFSHGVFRDSIINNSAFIDCSFIRCHFFGSSFINVSFSGTTFYNCTFHRHSSAEFKKCNFKPSSVLGPRHEWSNLYPKLDAMPVKNNFNIRNNGAVTMDACRGSNGVSYSSNKPKFMVEPDGIDVPNIISSGSPASTAASVMNNKYRAFRFSTLSS